VTFRLEPKGNSHREELGIPLRSCFHLWSKQRFFNQLEGFRECTSLSLPGTQQREGGTFRDANEQIEEMLFKWMDGNGSRWDPATASGLTDTGRNAVHFMSWDVHDRESGRWRAIEVRRGPVLDENS